MARRLYIGHHFFGSGNIGDDFMLGGFVDLSRRYWHGDQLACATPFDRDCQALRFPDISWLPYDRATRERAIAESDAWLGVGDTPFQTDVGTWFLEHLIEDAELCARHRTPMFFFGVGLNNTAALTHPLTRRIIDQAEHIWARDAQAATLLRGVRGDDRITLGADLAHTWLAPRRPARRDAASLALLLNFEDRAACSVDAIAEVVAATADRRHAWLVQEVRPLPGSENDLWTELPASLRSRFDRRAPDYRHGTLPQLLACWGAAETVVTSRYHAAIAGAWSGARVVIIERNDKLRGLVEQFGIASVGDLRAAGPVIDAIASAQPVPRHKLLEAAARVEHCAAELSARLGACARSAATRVTEAS